MLYDEALDETGTVDTAELTESDADSLGEDYEKKTNNNNFRTGRN